MQVFPIVTIEQKYRRICLSKEIYKHSEFERHTKGLNRRGIMGTMKVPVKVWAQCNGYNGAEESFPNPLIGLMVLLHGKESCCKTTKLL